jgi:hypothetical protein
MFGHPEWLECSLCGDLSADVAPALMALEEAGRVRYGHGPRCKDHAACRRRVDEAGVEWPLADGLPAQQHKVVGR